MKVLVTGRAGSGKTAVATELKRRNYNAFDSDDVPELSSWQDKQTGELAQLVDNSYVDLHRLHWVWNASVLEKLLKNNADVFLCGGADNDLSFYGKFDHHFVLNIEPDLQIKRLQTRTNNNYGSDPRMYDAIVAKEAAHVTQACQLGATALDASQPIEQVVDTLLAAI